MRALNDLDSVTNAVQTHPSLFLSFAGVSILDLDHLGAEVDDFRVASTKSNDAVSEVVAPVAMRAFLWIIRITSEVERVGKFGLDTVDFPKGNGGWDLTMVVRGGEFIAFWYGGLAHFLIL